MPSVAKKRTTNKKQARDARILQKARKQDGAEKPVTPERAGIYRATSPKGAKFALFEYEELQRIDRLLARAADSALKAAPRQVPQVGWGMAAAVAAHDDIRQVREAIATALGGAT